MDNIDIYRNSSLFLLRKTPSKIISWILILIVSAVIFLIISLKFKYKNYITYEGIIKNGYLEFYVDNDFFNRHYFNKVVINRKEYSYQIMAFEEYSYNLGIADYWKVTIKVDVPNEWIIENNRINLLFLRKEETVAQNLIDKIKKGLEK